MIPWEGITPRRWQADALPLAIDAARRGERTIVSAIMGAGKSVLIAELARVALPRSAGRAIVVATPTQALVRQLSATLSERVGRQHVGVYYGEKKQPLRSVIVTCCPSLANLQAELATQGRRTSLLIFDEVHRSEAAAVREVVPLLDPAAAIGFTATPFRSLDTETLSLWTSICYRYTLGDALRDRVLVPFHAVPFLERTRDALGTDALDAVALDMIRRNAHGPGIVSALSIPDAERFAAVLTAAGIPASAIHSGQPTRDRIALLEQLQTGELHALVHVSLLAEGVDLPWLRWLCLRRPVGARVRFFQEIGRVLRGFPGKDHAVIMDPHDLLGAHGVQHAEALGEALQAEADEQAVRATGTAVVAQPLPPATALDAATVWARGLLLALQAVEAVPADILGESYWRTRRPSEAQLRTAHNLGRTYARHLPAGYSEAVMALCRPHVSAGLQRGAVSDLISVLRAVADAAPRGGWEERKWWRFPWPDALEVPPLGAGVVDAIPERATKRWTLAVAS